MEALRVAKTKREVAQRNVVVVEVVEVVKSKSVMSYELFFLLCNRRGLMQSSQLKQGPRVAVKPKKQVTNTSRLLRERKQTTTRK